MLKRTIIVTSPSRLTLKNGQLVCTCISDDTDVKTAPVEDIGIVIVENQRATLSVPLISALAANNASVVFCDSHFMPSSVTMSLCSNATQSEMLKAQVSATEATNNRLWKQIIEAKIKNQASLLGKLGKDSNVLKPYYSNVKSGDADNREGIAARLYWKELFGSDFSRERDGGAPNNMLNYGYSILRTAVVRALLGSGLNLGFGIFHRNKYNPMPLADDVMEPFRPFVDEIVYELVCNGEIELTTEVKSFIVDVLSCDTVFDNNKRPLQVGLSMTTASLGRCYLEKQKKLSLPKLE